MGSGEDKKSKNLPAFRITAEMHEGITQSAMRANRKVMDQVRYLIERGLQAEDGPDVTVQLAALEQRLIQLERGRGSPQKNKGAAGHG